ncbi:MAG: cytochrome b N-terminal domain-containing protein [Thaumarchaeota archaeon]|nr:cytochrome b N-terminal domain-containing protein [Nitrososphaerota archaeon]
MFVGVSVTFPRKFVSPLGFLGMLTFVTFLLLGVTGALLMLYFEPTLTGAFDSVELIAEEIPFGNFLRNIHYHSSNAMIFLALIHMYYNFFSGRFKLKNEFLWVTGILLGTLTILEAFTGYDLIFNERAVLAISIGVSLNAAAPFLGPTLAGVMMGTGFGDVILRFYAFHVFIVPLLMVIIMFIHFPRYLVLDLPIIMATIGGMVIVGGLVPVPLGIKFEPLAAPGITVPEWYLTGLYAFIRTGVDKFVSGVIIPTLFILMFMVVPFLDKSKSLSWKDRPFWTALGITSVVQILVTTFWGFFIPNTGTLTKRLFIEPLSFYGILIIIPIVTYGATYGFLRWVKSREAGKPRRRATPGKPISIPRKWVYTILVSLVLFQVGLNSLVYQAFFVGFENLILFEVGLILLAFSVVLHLYRLGTQSKLPS